MKRSEGLDINALIEARGFRKDAVAEMMGMHVNAFYNRCNGWTRFRESEVQQLSEILGVHPSIIRRVVPLPVRESA